MANPSPHIGGRRLGERQIEQGAARNVNPCCVYRLQEFGEKRQALGITHGTAVEPFVPYPGAAFSWANAARAGVYLT